MTWQANGMYGNLFMNEKYKAKNNLIKEYNVSTVLLG